jgi:hypothetical protein
MHHRSATVGDHQAPPLELSRVRAHGRSRCLRADLATLEVRQDPRHEDYAAHQTLGSDAVISPLVAPTAMVRAADLLP